MLLAIQYKPPMYILYINSKKRGKRKERKKKRNFVHLKILFKKKRKNGRRKENNNVDMEAKEKGLFLFPIYEYFFFMS